MKLSGFTFVHNALEGGYPIREAIAAVQPFVDDILIVDMQSTDGTDKFLEDLKHNGDYRLTVLNSPWVMNKGREPLHNAFKKHVYCNHDTIVFFEADEVFDNSLLEAVTRITIKGVQDIAVHRLQIERNFQRCRWYPIPVHRIIRKGSNSYLNHPTEIEKNIFTIGTEHGFLWDCTNCFRDNWRDRQRNQAELWGPSRNLMVPLHFTESFELERKEFYNQFSGDEWKWTRSPFDIPDVLKHLVGKTKYE